MGEILRASQSPCRRSAGDREIEDHVIGNNGRVNVLTPQEIEQLVALRLGMTDALSRSKNASKYRRGAVIVALDAMIERSSSIVAVTRGLGVPTNGKLDDLISRLVQDMGSSWKPVVLPDIKQLRRARNASQHDGLEPDREQLPLWADATDSYISSLIEAQFGVDIHRIALSDAIRDASLRALIREAEEAKARGNYRLCVDKAKESYESALRTWNRLRGDGASHGEPWGRDVLDQKSYKYLAGQLRDIRRVFQKLAFASNVAEAEWFTAAIDEHGDVLTADDAERVLTFAFEWVVECEHATEAWTPNRQHRAAVAKRLVRALDHPARIDKCVSVDFQHGKFRAVFRIADVPGEDEYPVWARTLEQLLPTSPNGWSEVSDDGSVTLHRPADGSVDFAGEVRTLSAALEQAHGAVKDRNDAEAEKQRIRAQRDIDFAESIAGIRHALPQWVEGIELSNGGFSSDVSLLVTVAEEVSDLRFGEEAPGSYDRKWLRDVFLDHDFIQGCYGAGDPGQLYISPVLGPQQLTQLFDDVAPVVSAQLKVQKRLETQQQQRLDSARTDIATELAQRQLSVRGQDEPSQGSLGR